MTHFLRVEFVDKFGTVIQSSPISGQDLDEIKARARKLFLKPSPRNQNGHPAIEFRLIDKERHEVFRWTVAEERAQQLKEAAA